MGPTASGKSELAERLADLTGAQLLNADAFQVYRGLDIGTAKPADKGRYLLLDLVEPSEQFGVGQFVSAASDALKTLWDEGRSVILVGGTGLYVRALLEQYKHLLPFPDPQLRESLNRELQEQGLSAMAAKLSAISPDLAQQTDLANPVRVLRAIERAVATSQPLSFSIPPFRIRKFGLVPELSTISERIAGRLQSMLDSGFVEEVGGLLDTGVSLASPGMRAIGYQAIALMVAGILSREAARERILNETRQFAKRQRTWLRSEPDLVTHESIADEGAYQAVLKLLELD
jgi:tRNA dimethylallyltransferase